MRLVGVRGKSWNVHLFAPHGHHLAEDRNFFCAFQNLPSQGTGRLIADKQDRTTRIGQITDLVVQNATAVRHAGASHNDFRRLDTIDTLGLFGRKRKFQLREVQNIVAATLERPGHLC